MPTHECPTCRLVSQRYRFVFTEARGPRIDGVQLSRVTLYNKEHQAIPLISAKSPGAVDLNSFQRAGELVQKVTAYDGLTRAEPNKTRQWYAGALPAALDLLLEVPSRIAAYELHTAHTQSRRDPISWLFGAIRPDGRFVVLRSVSRAEAPIPRLESYGVELLGSFVRPGAILPGNVREDAAVGPAVKALRVDPIPSDHAPHFHSSCRADRACQPDSGLGNRTPSSTPHPVPPFHPTPPHPTAPHPTPYQSIVHHSTP